jgi:hypothetical protein
MTTSNLKKAIEALIAAMRAGKNYGDALCGIAIEFDVSRTKLAEAYDNFCMTDHEQ